VAWLIFFIPSRPNLRFRYYVEPFSVVIVGKPSASLAEKLERDEKARITAQVEKLGPDGLKRAEAELQMAKAEHDRPIPTEILTSFPVPDVKSISWIPVQSVQEPGHGRKTHSSPSVKDPLFKHIQSDGQQLPFFVQYDHVEVSLRSLLTKSCNNLHLQSDFVSLHALFNLTNLPNRLRP